MVQFTLKNLYAVPQQACEINKEIVLWIMILNAMVK